MVTETLPETGVLDVLRHPAFRIVAWIAVWALLSFLIVVILT